MKNIFKKNQIIITALAIMIAVAGYLNLSKDKVPTDNPIQTSGNDVLGNTDADGTDEANKAEDWGKLAENENDIYADISDEDSKQQASLDVNDKGEIQLSDNKEDVTQSDKDSLETGKTEAEKANDSKTEDGKTEDGKTEDGKEASTPGEAVLASTSLDNGFFSSAKLTREQMRAKTKEQLMGLISDTNISEAQKQEAIDNIIDMTAIAEKENAAEILLEAKGFEGAVVSLVEGKVDVVVNSPTITDQQVAVIEDIITRKTGVALEDIVITSVVVEE